MVKPSKSIENTSNKVAASSSKKSNAVPSSSNSPIGSTIGKESYTCEAFKKDEVIVNEATRVVGSGSESDDARLLFDANTEGGSSSRRPSQVDAEEEEVPTEIEDNDEEECTYLTRDHTLDPALKGKI